MKFKKHKFIISITLVLIPISPILSLSSTNFDHLGLESLALTPLEQELSDLAHQHSLKNLEKFGVQLKTQTANSAQNVEEEKKHHHERVKRGGWKKKKKGTNNLGYYALPIPPLPPDISKESTRLFTRPNKRLIQMANKLAIQKRQGAGVVLPPAVNQNFARDEDRKVNDPFLLTVSGKQNYPNSIQDVLSHVEPPNYTPPQHQQQYNPPSNPPNYSPPHYQGILTPHNEVVTTKPPKKVIYKVIVTKKPEKAKNNNEHGTTKKIVYKLATKPTQKPHKTTPKHTTTSATKKPDSYIHTRKPETVHSTRSPYHEHTLPPQTIHPKDPPAPHKTPMQYPNANPPKQQENYLAVIPYKDIAKLFELLNKHTKPMSDKHMKIRHKTTSKPHLPPPTTKRTEILQPKVIKRTPLGHKKKKKKMVHVSFS